MVRIAALALAAAVLQACASAPPNPQIDYAAFARDVDEVGAVREARRVSEDEFIRMAGPKFYGLKKSRSRRIRQTNS